MDRFAHLEWPFFEPRHAELARAAARWAAENLSFVDDDDEDSVCRRLVKDLGAAGFLAHCAPADSRFDVRSLAVLREVLAFHSGLADFALTMQGLGSGPIALEGTEAQKRRYVAGSDAAALSMRAVHDGAHYVLDGAKTWISNGGIADFYIVFARTGDAGTKGISAFVVDADAPGLLVEERIEIVAPHPMATLRFEGCRVPKSSLIGAEGEGFKLAMRTLDIFRTGVAAAALGFARRALAEALLRARERTMFGQQLADFQMTQGKLADMATGIESAALLAYRAAWTRDVKDRRVTREAAMAKMQATETAQAVVDAAVQICGGLGVKRGHPVERLYREVRALRIYEGATEVQKLIIARELLKEPS
jgi:acyl-CoA dehydrogenase